MVTSCALCSDTATVAEVVAVYGATAIVRADGCASAVAVALIGDVETGDLLLCHAGIALQKVDE